MRIHRPENGISLFKNKLFSTKDSVKYELYVKCQKIYSNFLLKEL